MPEESIEQTETGASASNANAPSRRRTIEYFKAKDAVEHSVSGIMGLGVASDETKKKLATVREAGRDEGIDVQVLFRQPGGYSLLLVWAKPNYPLVRHSHDADCLYYVVSGSVVAGTMTMRAGDGFFVPGDCLYTYVAGPEGAEVLEIRHGVDLVNTVVAPVSDKRVETELALVRANVDRWKDMRVSPTFAANGTT